MRNSTNNLKLTSNAGYPFCAIVGQDDSKLALILNVIDRSIGGVLLMGHRGTGKSTAVRALAELLPNVSVAKNCVFNCDPNDPHKLCADCQSASCAPPPTPPKGRGVRTARLSVAQAPVRVVDLPLGATEDRVCGSIDIQRALKDGTKAFEPGLLARANRGFLYIDEVNLLEDHLVDLLLDVAVTGSNKVERENISIEHPAEFVLIGSGNPEEGELRPQLLDRFGLYVQVTTANEATERMEIVRRRSEYDLNRAAFVESFADAQQKLRRQITRAQRNLGAVRLDDNLLLKIATLCCELQIDGHRGELTIARAARAHATYVGRKAVSEDDIRRVAPLALRHRLRRDPLDDTSGAARIEQAVEKIFSTSNENKRRRQSNGSQDLSDSQARNGSNSTSEKPAGATNATLPQLKNENNFSKFVSATASRGRTGRRSINPRDGRYVRATAMKALAAKVAIDATLRAWLSAPGAAITDNLRFKQFGRKEGTLFIFAIDSSGSMARERIRKVKGAVLNLLKESYINRDSVALVAFRRTGAELLLPPSRSIVRARRALDAMPTGGGTPLSAGLACALDVAQCATNNQQRRVVLLLFTDGGANVPLGSVNAADRLQRQADILDEVSRLGTRLQAARVTTFVVEGHHNFATTGQVETIAKSLGAVHVKLIEPLPTASTLNSIVGKAK